MRQAHEDVVKPLDDDTGLVVRGLLALALARGLRCDVRERHVLDRGRSGRGLLRARLVEYA